jgi:hypothetical protein
LGKISVQLDFIDYQLLDNGRDIDSNFLFLISSGGEKKTKKSTITSITNDDLKPPGITVLEEILKVPDYILYSNGQYCSILQVSHYLEIDADKYITEMPIIITGVPLRLGNPECV